CIILFVAEGFINKRQIYLLPDMFGQKIILLLFERLIIRPLDIFCIDAGLVQEVFYHGAVVEDAVHIGTPAFWGMEAAIGEVGEGWVRVVGAEDRRRRRVGEVQRAGLFAMGLAHVDLIAYAGGAVGSNKAKGPADGCLFL